MKQTAAFYTARHYILQNLDGYMVIEVTYNYLDGYMVIEVTYNYLDGYMVIEVTYN